MSGGRPTARTLAAVFTGGCLGTAARAGLLEAMPPAAGAWPWATLIANVAGCLLLGAVAAWWAHDHDARALLGGGLCGALTTFSTFQLELISLAEHERAVLAVAYALTSVTLGLAAARAGRVLVGRVEAR